MQASRRLLLRTVWLVVAVTLGSLVAYRASARQEATPAKPAAKHRVSVLTNLVFDADTKSHDAELGDTNAVFQFNVTNTWTSEITIDRIETSCGCTAASMPSNPWHVAAGDHGQIGATVNLAGKGAGVLKKTLTLYLSTNGNFIGTRVATVKVTIPAQPALATLSESERKAAMAEAKSDPRKIFTDPACAKCHADPGRKMGTGPDLYAADCAICHDSPNRDSAVPDLHALKVQTSLEYWITIISYGKTNTMMPGFASFNGGPLNESQVHALAEYVASSEFALARKGDHSPTKSAGQ